MVVTEEKIREALVAPFAANEDLRLNGWTEAEFEKLFLEYYGRIVAVLFRLTGDKAQAEELAGDVFWKIYRQPLPADREHNIGGWLYRAATRVGIDALRAQGRRRKYEQAAGEAAARVGRDTPLDEVIREENRRRVRVVLAGMKRAQAQLLILRQSGLSYAELASVCGIKATSVGTLLARAEGEFEKRYQDIFAERK